MGQKSEISWTDSTWNPVTGCTPVSAGCDHCYAARYAKRGIGDFGTRYMLLTGEELGTRKFSQILLHPDRLEIPLRWRKPRRIFVCSMGDLFHESVPDDFIDKVFDTMAMCPQHTFQILTKRADRMRRWALLLPDRRGLSVPDNIQITWAGHLYPLINVWLGVTAENQAMADERIPLLLQTPAAVRFVSCEPLLGPIMIDTFLGDLPEDNEGAPYPGKLDWVIAGTESGPGRRTAQIDWFKALCDQCVAARVPFYLKQMDIGGELVKCPGLDGRQWLEFPVGDFE